MSDISFANRMRKSSIIFIAALNEIQKMKSLKESAISDFLLLFAYLFITKSYTNEHLISVNWFKDINDFDKKR